MKRMQGTQYFCQRSRHRDQRGNRLIVAGKEIHILKAMKLPKELQQFLKVAETVEEETLVFTKKKRPVAALVSLRRVDRESLALSTDPQFLRIIEKSRKEVRAGKTTSLEALERKFAVEARTKRMKQTQKTRRSS